MKKQLSVLGLILILGIMTLSGCIGQATKDFNKEYDADENTILQVTNINGPITAINPNTASIAYFMPGLNSLIHPTTLIITPLT